MLNLSRLTISYYISLLHTYAIINLIIISLCFTSPPPFFFTPTPIINQSRIKFKHLSARIMNTFPVEVAFFLSPHVQVYLAFVCVRKGSKAAVLSLGLSDGVPKTTCMSHV